MNKLLEGYEQRINEFVLKMAEKPIILKNNKDKYMTNRQKLYASTSNKILDKKGFVFKSYKSDKERIDEILKNKEILEHIFSKNNEKRRKQEFAEKIKEIKFIQPSMHFKKRSGLEKIYDIFKKKHYSNDEQKLLYNQLIKMGLIESNYIKYDYDDEYETKRYFLAGEKFNSTNNIFENNNNINYDIIKNRSLSDEEKYKKIVHDKILKERKNMLIKRKLLLNVGNKIKNINKATTDKLDEEEFIKTHFNAMENLSIFKKSTINHKLFKVWSMEDIAQQENLNESKKNFYKTISTNFSNFLEKKEKNDKKDKKLPFSVKNTIKKGSIKNIKNLELNNIDNNIKSIKNKNNDFNTVNDKRFSLTKFNVLNLEKRKSEFNFLEDEKILKDLEVKKDILNINPLLFRLKFDNIKNDLNVDKNKNKEDAFLEDKLKTLKRIAFQKGQEDNSVSSNRERLDTFYDDYKKDENIIIDGKYYKKYDTDQIAEKILKKCNWNHKKVNYKNMEGRSKLMFTNGLTVKEFESKYGIFP